MLINFYIQKKILFLHNNLKQKQNETRKVQQKFKN
jgi:hypothetical protein